jgi:N-acetylmuramoyl-L-alanine amidase
MRTARVILFAILALLVAMHSHGQDKNILSLVADLGAVLEWDPLRDSGVITFGQDRIALAVGTDSALVNYRLKVAIDPLVRKNGAVWLTTAAVAAIRDAVQKDRLAHAAEHMRVGCILIDPGHGGKDPGSVGSYTEGKKKITLREKDVTLAVATRLAGQLMASMPDRQVLLVRSDDTFVSLEDRSTRANALLDKTSDTILYVSIHANSSPNKKASGFEVWYLPPEYSRDVLDPKTVGKDNQDILAILNSMLEEDISLETTLLAQDIRTGLLARLGQKTIDRGLFQNEWAVLRNSRMPAVLVEVGFVSNEEEAARLSDEAYLKEVANGLYSGILAFISRFEREGNGAAR